MIVIHYMAKRGGLWTGLIVCGTKDDALFCDNLAEITCEHCKESAK